ncbi:MAG: hypothetical protein MUC88_12970 [Planctomycetes bacterium]|jgi:hypothetical protein|nr:hypothetical protein [Planctomycetota bacterium]
MNRKALNERNRARGAAPWALLMVLAPVLLASATPASASLTLYGPSAYRSEADSPFTGLTMDYFHLENFEDGLLNTPGVTVSGGYGTKPTWAVVYADSVDGDDGILDGLGQNGNAWFFASGTTGLTFTFEAGVLGALPTHAGLVWTDGLNSVTFQAYNAWGDLLGTIGPANIADGSFAGTTGEDRFFGISDDGGIWKIAITAGAAGIEIDHLQYGYAPDSGMVPPVPVPGAALLGVFGLSLTGWCLRRHAA